MFEMIVTRFAAPDGLNVKEVKAGQMYAESELSEEIFEAYKSRGELIKVKPETEPETETNVLPTVKALHAAKRKGGVK